MPTFPRKSYDGVRSEVIRDAIRSGSFDDDEHRGYVNALVYVEWKTTDGLHPDATGLSCAGASRTQWRIATKYPEAYDAVRREFDAETRAEYTWGWRGEEDPDERRRWARRHRDQWTAVRNGTRTSTCGAVYGTDVAGRSSFAPFRFPAIPYDRLKSAFVRSAVERGEFDEFEHRRRVNELVFIEAWTRKPRAVSGGYPPVRPWIAAAKHPTGYDCIRDELGGATREDLDPLPDSPTVGVDVESRESRCKRDWRTVQQTAESQRY